MNTDAFISEQMPGIQGITRIKLNPSVESDRLISQLAEEFEKCFARGDANFLVDFDNLLYPTSDLIALLIEVRSRTRRRKGELIVVHVPFAAKSNLASFSGDNYLSQALDERSAMHAFPETPKHNHRRPDDANGSSPELQPFDRKDSTANTISQEPVTTPPQAEEKPVTPAAADLVAEDDIVDDPIVSQLREVVEEPAAPPAKSKEQSDQAETPPPSSGQTETPEIDSTFPEEDAAKSFHLRVASEAKNLYDICDFVTEHASQAGFDAKELGKTKIAVYEACLNVIEHAYHSKPDNWIDVYVEQDREFFSITIQDYGVSFEGFSDKDYDVMSAMDGRQTGGFGLYIIRRSMDELEYVPDQENGNRLRMVKYISTNKIRN